MEAVANGKEQAIPELEEATEVSAEEVVYVCDFEEGDKVVYPHHGAGLVMKKETRELMGEEREYLTIKILHNELTVMVPCENAGKAGLRRVIDEVEIKKVTSVLTDDVSDMPKNWNRRFKYNREKIKTGDVFELAEVVRNLALREMEKGLRKARRSTSTGCWRSASPQPRSSATASVTAVIAAAGSGERLGAGGPKAFVPLAGRPLVEWSIAAMRATACVRSIVIACPPGHVHELGGHDLGVVDGGATRSQSVANALAAVGTELVAIHDAARPLVTPELVEGVVATLAADPEADGAIAATPVSDTIKQAGEAGSAPAEGTRAALTTRYGANAALVVEATVDRGRLWAAQTPQVFRVDALRCALEADRAQVESATDEAMLIEAAGGRVLIHPSPPENLKVTTSTDLKLAELLLGERSAQ